MIKSLFVLGIVLGSVEGIAMAADECDEFVSKAACQVTISMSSVAGVVTPQYRVAPPAHADVMVSVGGAGSVVLTQASPFLSCTIAATPSVPTRDLSTAFTGLLTTLGTFALPAIPAVLPSAQSLDPGAAALDKIEAKVNELRDLEIRAGNKLNGNGGSLKQTLRANWQYSFPRPPADPKIPVPDAETDAAAAVASLRTQLPLLLNGAVPDLAAIQRLAKAIPDDMANFYKNSPPVPDSALDRRAKQIAQAAAVAAANADLLQSAASDLDKKIKPIIDFLQDVMPPYTKITLPMTPFKQKQSAEVVTCKDAVSATQPFDTIAFTAFYENTPVFDISGGALVSLLPGRQVGPVTAPFSATGAAAVTNPSPCTSPYMAAQSCLGVTSATRPQFMPATFLEYHPVNGKCFWATNGDGRHRFGYLCSLGLAGGFAVNPNNGTASAEFFEGVSLGIQRVSLLFGLHNGRYQTFADGYFVGEAIPTGVTPRTERIWTTHFAIGIAYRIPLR